MSDLRALSTGPTSPEGKAKSSRNSLKTGIYASVHTVLDFEDPEEIRRMEADYFESNQPVGPEETRLVRTLLMSDLISLRCDILEPAVIRQAADPSLPPLEAAAALMAQPKNNALANLHRRRVYATNTWFRAFKELERIQKIRKEKEAAAPKPEPALALPEPVATHPPAAPGPFVPANPQPPEPAPKSTSVPLPEVAPDTSRGDIK